MANEFQIARGRIVELAKRVIDGDPATSNFVIGLLKVAESDAGLETRATYADIIANNTGADFTNYGLVETNILTNLSITNGVSDVRIDCDDFVWVNAGGTLDNTLVKAVVFYLDLAANINTAVPLCHFNFPITTTGINLTFRTSTTGLYITG